MINAQPKEARFAERVDVGVTAWLREAGGAFRFTVDVTDLSATGYRFETSCSIAVGSRVFLALPTLRPLPGTITWHDAHVYGAHFDKPLYSAVFELIASRFPRLSQDR